jgi:hypothetical protein
MKNRYRIEKSSTRVYNGATRRWCHGYIVVQKRTSQLVPGTWTKKAATHMAKEINRH